MPGLPALHLGQDAVPAAAADLPRSTTGPSPAGAGPRVVAGVRHVLVVEDDSPIRAMLVDLLSDAGYAVLEAADGFAALQQLRQQRPDLIVLDLMLPGMSGWQFLERSREQLDRAEIPVVVVSAIRGQGDYPRMLGVATWLTKPLDVDRFLDAVEALVGPARPVRSAPAGSGAHPPAQVLVVEDEPIIRDLLVEHLAERGFQPHPAGSIAEARARIAAQRPSLIMLDLMLPGESGWAFLRERRTDPQLAAIPVLVISAAGQDRLLEAKELGGDAFVSKPFDLGVLSVMARTLVPG